jgi:hypothetical protein
MRLSISIGRPNTVFLAIAFMATTACGSNVSDDDSDTGSHAHNSAGSPGSGGSTATGGGTATAGSAGKAGTGGSTATAGSAGTGGSAGTSGSAGTGGGPTQCFGHPTADEHPTAFAQCLYSNCCGSVYSCENDAVCSQAYACALNATAQADFNACMEPLNAPENIASDLWFLNLYSCSSASCFAGAKPLTTDPCAGYTSCGTCLNGDGISSNGATGNCGWMTDGTCHSGSTKGPNDPAAWGDDLKWTYFDPDLCPGAPSPSGCTADADCGSCEYCERSTGKCLTRLTCP